MQNKISIALPKGRFLEKCKTLLKDLEIEIGSSKRYSFHILIDGIDINIKLLKMVDIPLLFKLGLVDITILCDEWIKEYELNCSLIKKLDWCDSRMVLATKKDFYNFEDIKLATSYPNLAKKYLSTAFKTMHILHISGSVEAMVPEYANAIFECVETGKTLKDNDLLIRETYMTSSVNLICKKSFKVEQYPNLLKYLNSI